MSKCVLPSAPSPCDLKRQTRNLQRWRAFEVEAWTLNLYVSKGIYYGSVSVVMVAGGSDMTVVLMAATKWKPWLMWGFSLNDCDTHPFFVVRIIIPGQLVNFPH